MIFDAVGVTRGYADDANHSGPSVGPAPAKEYRKEKYFTLGTKADSARAPPAPHQYKLYRALNLIDAVGEKNQIKIACEIRKTRRHLKKNSAIRTDTICKRLLTALSKNEISYSSSIKRFIHDYATQPDQIRILGHTYIFKRAMLESSPFDFLNLYAISICSKPYAHPKADFLQLLRKFKSKLTNAGISKDQIEAWITQIEKSSADSEVVTQYCVPYTKDTCKINQPSNKPVSSA